MKDFAKILSSRWLMDPAHLRPLMERIAAATPEAVAAAVQAYRDPQPKVIGDIAVIECSGPITGRNSWFSMWYGCSTIESMQTQFRIALADPNIKTIVFRVETPGGTIDLVPEFADEIFAAREVKNIIAVSDTMIASAGIWLFSQCTQIYVPRSGQIGSVGAYCLHQDVSKMLEDWGIKMTFIYAGENKVEGNSYEPLSDSAKAHFQEEIDQIFGWFNAAMARGRGVSTKDVLDNFGQGRMFYGQAAVKLGMADKVGTFDAVMSKLLGRKRAGVSASIESVTLTDTEGNAMPEASAAATSALAAKADDNDEGVDPNEDGTCEDGYELRDGKCYPVDEAKAATRAAIDREHVNIVNALAE